MNSKPKLVAGPAKVSVRLLTDEEKRNLGLEDLETPLCYGLITSLGYRYTYISIGDVVIFDITSAIKVNPDTYVIEEKMIIARFAQEKEKKRITPIEEVFGSEGIL